MRAGTCDFDWHYMAEVASTMDEAKRLLAQPGAPETLAVGAALQTSGRGTRGRAWAGVPGNVFLTVPFASLPLRPVTLVPLRVGVLVHRVLQQRLDWPNDVLLDGDKLAGMLIEMEGDHLLIGIGVNVASTPDAETLARELAEAVALLADWAARADWATPLEIRETAERVQPLRLLPDGRLDVRPLAGGPDKTLVAEYLL
ncbi:hypothetical protein M885DRAFT_555345 [Pelagophyceae sp. CCMP2097]|nr:hypothetical protein M885DRAFT_555345 [Pelagophyceae sp. CCMP2097]